MTLKTGVSGAGKACVYAKRGSIPGRGKDFSKTLKYALKTTLHSTQCVKELFHLCIETGA